MLPKADKDQIYLWIDAPENTPHVVMKDIAHDVETFLLGYKKLPPALS